MCVRDLGKMKFIQGKASLGCKQDHGGTGANN